MMAKDFFGSLSSGLATVLARVLAAWFGAGLDHPAVEGITWADLAAALCLIGFVFLVNGLTALLLRRKIRASAQADPTGFPQRLVGMLAQPLSLLIWMVGIYLAAEPLLLKLPTGGIWPEFRPFTARCFDLGVFAVLCWVLLRFTHVLETWLGEWTAKTKSKLDDLLVPLVGKSLRVSLPVVGLIFALPILNLPPEYAGLLSKGSTIALIVAVALIAAEAVRLVEQAVLARYDITAADNLQARKIYTQVHVLGKTLYFVIGLFTVASILMLFEEVRRLGASLLASAGVVGIIIGFAAQKTIANLFAGFQLALTQPIRLDDVVVVESEWGRIEEITLTYVVIRLWDERRLVVPLSYFIEKPFQNWTRASAELLGSVFVWVDYSLPLNATRQAVKEIIEKHPLWDQRFWNLQVTDATEKTMQIRVLATAENSAKSFDLRCDIREQLIAYIQKNHPHGLPQIRATLDRRS